MFVGHYGVSFAAKRAEPAIPLWVLFIAVQLLDVLWAPFVLLGIEKVRIVPGITASNPLDLYYMPYTHSLIGAIGWSVVAFLAYRFALRSASLRAAAIVGLTVFSHWVLDFLVHRPDLPLYDNSAKVGLGLWNLPAVAFGLEALLLFLARCGSTCGRARGVARRCWRSVGSCSRSRRTSSSAHHQPQTTPRRSRPSCRMRSLR